MKARWTRRKLLAQVGAAAAGTRLLGKRLAAPSLKKTPSTERRETGWRARSASGQRSSPIIDGLGEVRSDYGPELFAAMLESGINAVHITLGNPGLQGADALDDVVNEIASMDTHIIGHPEQLLGATSVADIDRAKREGRLALLYGLQNAAPIGDSVEILDNLRGYGVRILQLTYNYRNLLGDGVLERTDSGLSNFGIEVVERMNQIGMLIDLSHCGEATTLDGLRFSSRPAAFTHTGCRALFDHPRNKSDTLLRELAERGGVVGIYQINPYLSAKERSSLDDYLDHIDHAVNVAGVDHVGISELNHPRRMVTIAEGLQGHGYTSAQIDKILGGNWYRLYSEVIG